MLRLPTIDETFCSSKLHNAYMVLHAVKMKFTAYGTLEPVYHIANYYLFFEKVLLHKGVCLQELNANK